MTTGDKSIDEVHTIFAGKFRRYHGESWLKRLVDLPTNLKNVRDGVYLAIGYLQSRGLVRRIKPDVIFLKGGYVGLPVGLAAVGRKVPFITHDSDALPGLSNRLVAKWAKLHATGMPPEYYSYPPNSVRYTGVLVGDQFKPVNSELMKQYRQDLNLPVDGLVLLITGGSLGAERLNKVVMQAVPRLLAKYSNLTIIHQVGQGKTGLYKDLTDQSRVQELEFMNGMERYMGAADVVVTRAGANTLAELGVQGKALVVVPNPLLTAGHQLKNADYLTKNQAVLTVSETELTSNSDALTAAIEQLLDDPAKRRQLGKQLQSLTKPNAASALADLLIEVAENKPNV